MTDAATFSETSVHLYQNTQHQITGDSNHYIFLPETSVYSEKLASGFENTVVTLNPVNFYPLTAVNYVGV
jgi:hypothetical protein